MFIHTRRGWEIAEGRATPEAIVLGRRAVLGAAAGAGALAAGARKARAWGLFGGGSTPAPVPLKPLAAPRNPKYKPGRAITPEREVTHYNNFYEFGMSKDVADAAQALPIEPWTIEIAGMVKTPRKLGFDELW